MAKYHQLKYAKLAEMLDVELSYLSYKCGRARGTHLAWILREIICCKWENLNSRQQDMAFSMLSTVINPEIRNSSLLSELFDAGFLVFADPMLQRYATELKSNTPHMILV